MKIIEKLLEAYKDTRLHTRKKARVLLYTCIFIGMADIFFSLVMIFTKAYTVSFVGLFLVIFCISTIFLIYKKKYYLASNIFLFFLFMAMFVAIKFDAYVNVYETYVFATLGLVLLIMGSLVGYTRIQLYVIMFLDVAAILILYFVDILPGADYVVNDLHIQNLATSIIMVLLGSITGIILITLQRGLLASLEKETWEIKRMLRITEVYTKKSLISRISTGDDPTKFIPRGQDMTILFSDIRKFTTVTEMMKPIDVIGFLNSYFNRMNKVIHKFQGEIDKLIGDGFMATFTDTGKAVTSAYKMKLALQEYNKDRTSWNLLPLCTGIGICYGPVVVGNIGSESKMDYTLIGDIVNVCSRLESLTKHYAVDIIISEECVPFIEQRIACRFLDSVRVKGRSQSIDIYEVFEHEPERIKKVKFMLIPRFKEAFEYYRKADFEKARKLYMQMITDIGPHRHYKRCCADPVLNYYQRRCEYLIKASRRGSLDEENWDGVYTFDRK